VGNAMSEMDHEPQSQERPLLGAKHEADATMELGVGKPKTLAVFRLQSRGLVTQAERLVLMWEIK
jgi:hypothetical protein